jgi:ubiquinone/menaquinone biosynthesis C-methylase UbiE
VTFVKNTVENNLRRWNQQYHWSKDGDEWNGQASSCHKPYNDWKQSVVETFIAPNVSGDAVVLEIAPGHGRWTREVIDRCKAMILVDVSPNCIDFCRDLFAQRGNVTYVVNDGTSLPGVKDNSVDFIWSYDAFVHMDESTIDAYLGEMQRVLAPRGKAVIHHAGRADACLWLSFLADTGKAGRHVYRVLSMGKPRGDDGWRSNISGRLFKRLAAARGFAAESQVQWWGKNKDFGVPRYGDLITTLRKA